MSKTGSSASYYEPLTSIEYGDHHEREDVAKAQKRKPQHGQRVQWSGIFGDPEEDAIVFRRVAVKADWLAVLGECLVPKDDLPPRRRELPCRRKL